MDSIVGVGVLLWLLSRHDGKSRCLDSYTKAGEGLREGGGGTGGNLLKSNQINKFSMKREGEKRDVVNWKDCSWIKWNIYTWMS